MHDYKNHRAARRLPEWAKITIGLTFGLPIIYAYVVILLSL